MFSGTDGGSSISSGGSAGTRSHDHSAEQREPDVREHARALEPACAADELGGGAHVLGVGGVAGEAQRPRRPRSSSRARRGRRRSSPRCRPRAAGERIHAADALASDRRADAEELAQEHVLRVHRDVRLQLVLPPAIGVLKPAQVLDRRGGATGGGRPESGTAGAHRDGPVTESGPSASPTCTAARMLHPYTRSKMKRRLEPDPGLERAEVGDALRGPARSVARAAWKNQASRISASSASAVERRLKRKDVRIVPAARAGGGDGVVDKVPPARRGSCSPRSRRRFRSSSRRSPGQRHHRRPRERRQRSSAPSRAAHRR